MKNSDDPFCSPLSFIKFTVKSLSKVRVFFFLFFLGLGQALYVTLPLAIGFIVDRVYTHQTLTIHSLYLFPLIWIFAVISLSASKFFSSFLLQDVRKATKLTTFNHLLSLPHASFIDKDAGSLEYLMQELSFCTRYLLGETLPLFVRMAITLFVSTLVILQTSPWLIFTLVAWGAIYIPFSYYSSKNAISKVSESLSSSSEVSAYAVDTIQNHELIQSFGTYEFEGLKFQSLLEKERHTYYLAQYNIDKSDLYQSTILISLPFLLTTGLIFFNDSNAQTPGTIASLFSFCLIFLAQIGGLGKGMLGTIEIFERINTTVDKLSFSSPKKEPKKTIHPKRWEISFQNITFKYDKKPVLDNLSLTIHENEKIGLVGCSGAGKTTILKLLKKYYTPQEGKICIGGKELDTFSTKFLSKNIAEVSQTVPLFHRSIRENIVYGCENCADEEIWKILEKAQLAEIVSQLPGGLDTKIGVRGYKLSGGERARIGIARAFLRDAKIILLDEATASLDSKSERFLQKGLDSLAQNRTIIAIAHRLSTVKMMDRILVVEKGKIVAGGSHENLLETSPIYRNLWNS